jgi:6-phospho-beta-glucosidase
MSELKVAVIGGGSTYTPELVNGFLSRLDSFPLGELWLMDIDAARLEIVGGFARRMAVAKGAPFQVYLTTQRQEALRGAAYVITQLRVGKMEARRADEYLGRRHGLIGQETTGIGGMAKALRTIPVILDIANEMLKLAPNALLVNFTNPSGLITQALHQHAPHVSAIGLCNAPFTAKMGLLEELQKSTATTIDPERAELNTLGLNHLSWHRGLTLDGEDIWPRILKGYLAGLKADPKPEWEPRLIETLGMIPNYYLHYFYNTAYKLSEQEKWPPSRAEEVMLVENDLLRQYADPALSQPPPDLMKRGGAYYSTVAVQLLNAHYNDLDETHVVNVSHAGAVPEWPVDWVLEMPCRVNRSGAHPLPAEPLPLVCYGLLAQVKVFELLTITAAVNGDRHAAYQALLSHPLGPDSDHLPAVLDDMLVTQRAYLPRFWGPGP